MKKSLRSSVWRLRCEGRRSCAKMGFSQRCKVLLSEYIQTKASRLVEEQWVFELFRGKGYSIFQVEGDTDIYQVHLSETNTPSCTCLHWVYRHTICSHILACQLYSEPPHPEEPDELEEGLTPKEIERLVTEAADLFNPTTWR